MQFPPQSQAISLVSFLSPEQVKERIKEGLRARFSYSMTSDSSTTSVVGEDSSPIFNEVGEPLDMVVISNYDEAVGSEPDLGLSLLL